MQITFDSTCRLQRGSYLFEYNGVRFKLFQNEPRRWADALLTIVPMNNSAATDRAFAVGSEFLSALAFENGAASSVWGGGGAGWPEGRSLRRARPTLYDFPRTNFRGFEVGANLTRVPHVQTNDQREALTVFREARSANNDYLALLFFWQVLEVGAKGGAVKFVNDALRKHRSKIYLPESVKDLPLGARKLGDYLLEDWRHAIAHINRKPGLKKLIFDKPEELKFLAISVRVLEELAKLYIRTELGLSEHVFLVRPRRGGFPRFADAQMIESGDFVPAYPFKPFRIGKRRSRGLTGAPGATPKILRRF